MIIFPDKLKTQDRLIAAACVFCIICMFPGIWSAHYQLIGDDVYQILNCRYPRMCPMAPLTAVLGYPFTLLTGHILHFRFLSLALNYVAVFCMAAWLIKRCPGNAASILAATGVSLWLAGLSPVRSWMFGWDSFSTLFLTLTLISALSLRGKPTWRRLVLCALACAGTTLSRIPDAIVIPFLCPYLLWVCRDSGLSGLNTLKRIGFFLLTSVTAVITFLLAMYGAPANYLAAWQESTLTHHSLQECFNYMPYLKHSFGISSRLIVLYLAFDFLASGKTKLMLRICLMALTAWGMYMTMRESSDIDGINIYSVCLIFILIAGVLYFRRERAVRIQLLLTAGIMYAALFGSNCGIFKLMIIPVVPLLLEWLRPKWHISMTIFIVSFMSILSYMTFVSFKYNGCFEAPLKDMVEFQKAEELKGLHSYPAIVEMVEMAANDVEPYRQEGYRVKVLSTGFARFYFELMFNDRNPVLAHYWSRWPAEAPVDQFTEYVKQVAESKEPIVVLCVGEILYKRLQETKPIDEEWMPILQTSMRRIPTSSDRYAIYVNRQASDRTERAGTISKECSGK